MVNLAEQERGYKLEEESTNEVVFLSPAAADSLMETYLRLSFSPGMPPSDLDMREVRRNISYVAESDDNHTVALDKTHVETAVSFLTTDYGSMCWYEGNRELTQEEVAAVHYFTKVFGIQIKTQVREIAMSGSQEEVQSKQASNDSFLERLKSIFK